MVEQATNDGEQATILCCSLIFPAESPVPGSKTFHLQTILLPAAPWDPQTHGRRSRLKRGYLAARRTLTPYFSKLSQRWHHSSCSAVSGLLAAHCRAQLGYPPSYLG